MAAAASLGRGPVHQRTESTLSRFFWLSSFEASREARLAVDGGHGPLLALLELAAVDRAAAEVHVQHALAADQEQRQAQDRQDRRSR